MLEKITGTENDGVSRRDVLKTAATGAGMLAALPMLISTARADDQTPPTPPAKPSEDWKQAGDATDFKQNEPKRVDLGITVAWVTRLDTRNFEAVSAKCTHRGCELGYDAQSTHLICPCHGGTFNVDGSNVFGTRRDPSTALPHLKALPARVNKDGQVEVNVAPME
jgi:nitrite reductase/ring-hydroxylating ferredoxin subunit